MSNAKSANANGGRTASLDFGVRGWILIIYCFMSFLLGGAFLGVWQLDVMANTEILGWNSDKILQLMNIAGVIVCLSQIAISPAMTKAKFNLSRISYTMFLLFGIACLGMGWQAQSVVAYNIFFVLGYFFNQFQSILINNMITGNWFPHRRTMVVGITSMAIPLGSTIGSGLYAVLMNSLGHFGMMVLYFAVSAVFFGVGLVFVKDYPEMVGEYPDNDKSVSRDQLNKEFQLMKAMQDNNVWSIKTLLTNKTVWIMILTAVATFNINGIFLAQCVNRLFMYGTYDFNQARTVLTIAGVASIFGSFGCGLIDSWFTTKKLVIFMLGTGALATLLQLSNSYTVIIIGTVICGFILGGSSNVVLTMSAETFPRESMGGAQAIIQPVMNLIVMGLNAAYLMVAAAAQSYKPVYIFYICMAVVAILLVLFKYDPAQVRLQDEELKQASGYYEKMEEARKIIEAGECEFDH